MSCLYSLLKSCQNDGDKWWWWSTTFSWCWSLYRFDWLWCFQWDALGNVVENFLLIVIDGQMVQSPKRIIKTKTCTLHNVCVESMKIWIDNTTLSKAILLMKSKLFVGAQWCSKSTAGSCVGSNAAAELCIEVLTMFSNICGVRFKSTPLSGEICK